MSYFYRRHFYYIYTQHYTDREEDTSKTNATTNLKNPQKTLNLVFLGVEGERSRDRDPCFEMPQGDRCHLLSPRSH
jgi:hypothetical protein